MTATITILAVADTHIDDRTALAGMTPIADSGRPLVLEQAARMMAWVAEVAQEHQVGAILHAGDVFERPRPSPASMAVACEGLSAWAAVAPVAVLLGNHDMPKGTDAHALEPIKQLRPGRVFVLDTPEPIAFPLAIHDEYAAVRFLRGRAERPEIMIYPLPYPTRAYLAAAGGGTDETNAAMSELLDVVLQGHAQFAQAETRPCFLLGHGTLRGAAYSAHQTVPLTDVQVSTDHFGPFIPVWGHLHQRQAPVGWGAAKHGYVGAPDRHDFGEEHEIPGVTLFTLTEGPEGYEVAWEHIPYPGARVFRTLQVEELLALRVDTLDPETVFRVVGTVGDAEAYDALCEAVRALKRAGVLIKNETAVDRPDRVRVELDESVTLDLDGALRAACRSRADLEVQTDAIVDRVAQLHQGAA